MRDMRVKIPVEVPEDLYDLYSAAYIAGWKAVHRLPSHTTITRDDYPDAYDAGVGAAFQKLAKGAIRS